MRGGPNPGKQAHAAMDIFSAASKYVLYVFFLSAKRLDKKVEYG